MDVAKTAEKATESKADVSLTGMSVNSKRAIAVASNNGKRIATVKAVFDQGFVERARRTWVWVHWKDAPSTEGWHMVDRPRKKFVPATSENALQRLKDGSLQWHEVLYVDASVQSAAAQKRPLDLNIDCGCTIGNVLVLSGFCFEGVEAKVAQVDFDHPFSATYHLARLRS